MLTVIKRVENKGKQVRYLCKCDCGNEKIFYSTNLKCLIEYQGIQHYSYNASWKCSKDAFEDGQIRDNLKREYCIKNSINLIEIPYWDFNKINYEYIKEKIGQ